MKIFLLTVSLISLVTQSAFSHGKASKPSEDVAREITFPNTNEYLTLVLDPHTHSVFSDGHVWPRIRVGEALRDGLDAMAITEHLEYQPHLEDIPHSDRNRSYQDAAAAAEGTDLMVVPGAEITRSSPASHMNAVFITDANKLYSVPVSDEAYSPNEFNKLAKEWPAQNAVQAANDQGAFVFWNHSWWKPDFPNGIPVIPEFHIQNARNGLLHGIEIANGENYSEDAFQIALDYNLTLIGVSDVHNLIDWDYEPHKGGHRPVTLVLAEERTQDSMKAALFEGRTVVWFRNWLIGREAHLRPLLEASLKITEATYANSEILNVEITNHSDADLHLKNLSPYGFHNHGRTFIIAQHSTEEILVKTGEKVDHISLEFEVLNAFTAPQNTAMLTLEAAIE